MKLYPGFGSLRRGVVMLLGIFLAAPTMGNADGFLHTQGEKIVDADGKPILLRGVGLGNWLLPEGYMWRLGKAGDRPRRIEKIVSDLVGLERAAKFWQAYRDQYIMEADIRRIAELGFNSVRAVLNARLFMSEDDGSFRDEGFQLLDRLIGWCKASGVYVIIDMHAAPGGQTGQNIDDSADDLPALFIEKENQERLCKLWTKIAERYKDEPIVAAYDLLNEPLPELSDLQRQHLSQLEPLYKRVTQAIRAVDSRHMITVEGANWANDWSVFTGRFDDNLVYQFHYYCWGNPAELKDFGHYLSERTRLGSPIWVGETGERDDAIYWATTHAFEANHIGWSFWPWKKMAAANAPYSIKAPDDWGAIAAVSRDAKAPKPSAEAAQKALDQLLQNIQLENCVYHPDVVNALFRRVPGRVEAENYGIQGEGISYSVKQPEHHSGRYRKSEPVPVEGVDSQMGRLAGQGIRLTEGEWVSYDINSLERKAYVATIKIKAQQAPAVVQLSLDGTDANERLKLTIKDDDWKELPAGQLQFGQGGNRVKLAVVSGAVSVDWLEFQ